MAVHSYSDKLRIRVNGLLVKNDAVLLAHIHSPVSNKLIWTPPGGGLEYGESMKACLRREFMEETGLKVKVHELVFINELIEPPFHAVEFYFKTSLAGGTLKLGSDPEQQHHEQLLQDVQWIDLNELVQINLAPESLKHILAGRKGNLSGNTVLSAFHPGS